MAGDVVRWSQGDDVNRLSVVDLPILGTSHVTLAHSVRKFRTCKVAFKNGRLMLTGGIKVTMPFISPWPIYPKETQVTLSYIVHNNTY